MAPFEACLSLGWPTERRLRPLLNGCDISRDASVNISDLPAALDKAAAASSQFGYISKESLSDVIALLSADPKYADFEDHTHMVGNEGAIFTHEKLARRLAMRARIVGGGQALEELHKYIDASEFQLQCALLLHNIDIDASYNFTNGVRLIAIDEMEDSIVRDELLRHRFDPFLGGCGECALVAGFCHKKQVHRTDCKPTDWSQLKALSQKLVLLDDTRLILSLCRPADYGIPVAYSATAVPKSLSFLTSGLTLSPRPEPRTAFGPSILKIEMQHADQMFPAFARLSDETRDRFRVALKRLNDYKIDREWANKSINLRICMENLFLNPDESEQITRRVSARAPEHTNLTRNRARAVYGFLSHAVHTGKALQHPTISESEIARELQAALRQFISDGQYPVWVDPQQGYGRRVLNWLYRFPRPR